MPDRVMSKHMLADLMLAMKMAGRQSPEENPVATKGGRWLEPVVAYSKPDEQGKRRPLNAPMFDSRGHIARRSTRRFDTMLIRRKVRRGVQDALGLSRAEVRRLGDRGVQQALANIGEGRPWWVDAPKPAAA